MVSNLVTSEEKKNLMTLFQTLDVNGDGQITKEELITGEHLYFLFSFFFFFNTHFHTFNKVINL